MVLTIFLCVVLVTSGSGLFYFFSKWKKSESEKNLIAVDLAIKNTELQEKEKSWQEKFSERESVEQEKLSEKEKSWRETLNEKEKSWQEKFSERESVEQEKLSEKEKSWRETLNEKEKSWQEKIKEKEQNFNEKEKLIESSKEKLEIAFKNLANEILEEQNKKFTENSNEKIGALLLPLGENIKEFKDKINAAHKTEIENHSALKEQLKILNEANKRICDDANNLTRALKGDNKAQGNWGEFILEKVLEMAGLTKDIDFNLQHFGKNDEGNALRPDAIINLPENKKIVVDSKVSLIAYEKYISENNEKFLAEHIKSLENHIKILSEKNYQKLFAANQTIDLVFLFVPIEAALVAALKNKSEIYEFALQKNIILVTPTTLLAAMRTVAYVLRQEKQHKNVVNIIDEVGKLFDKFAIFCDNINTLGNQIETTKKTYATLTSQLSQGNGNILGRFEKIRKMGISTTKKIPDFVNTQD